MDDLCTYQLMATYTGFACDAFNAMSPWGVYGYADDGCRLMYVGGVAAEDGWLVLDEGGERSQTGRETAGRVRDLLDAGEIDDMTPICFRSADGRMYAVAADDNLDYHIDDTSMPYLVAREEGYAGGVDGPPGVASSGRAGWDFCDLTAEIAGFLDGRDIDGRKLLYGDALSSDRRKRERAYANFDVPDGSHVLLVFDATLMGTCREGLVVTGEGIRVRSHKGAESIVWSDPVDVRLIQGTAISVNGHMLPAGINAEPLVDLLRDLFGL